MLVSEDEPKETVLLVVVLESVVLETPKMQVTKKYINFFINKLK